MFFFMFLDHSAMREERQQKKLLEWSAMMKNDFADQTKSLFYIYAQEMKNTWNMIGNISHTRNFSSASMVEAGKEEACGTSSDAAALPPI